MRRASACGRAAERVRSLSRSIYVQLVEKFPAAFPRRHAELERVRTGQQIDAEQQQVDGRCAVHDEGLRVRRGGLAYAELPQRRKLFENLLGDPGAVEPDRQFLEVGIRDARAQARPLARVADVRIREVRRDGVGRFAGAPMVTFSRP